MCGNAHSARIAIDRARKLLFTSEQTRGVGSHNLGVRHMDKPANRKPFRHLPPSPSETRPFCSCGLSRTFPFCDGTQMIAKTHRLGDLVPCGAPKQPPALEA